MTSFQISKKKKTNSPQEHYQYCRIMFVLTISVNNEYTEEGTTFWILTAIACPPLLCTFQAVDQTLDMKRGDNK